MRVAQVNFFADPRERAPERLLHDWPTLVDVAECASCSGIEVSVIQACRHTQQLRRNGVNYCFLPFGHGHSQARVARPLARLMRELAPDILHVHGLAFPQDVLALATLAPGVPVVLQDHADRPPRRWRRPVWRRQFAAVSGVAFCSLQQARQFEKAGLIRPPTRVYEVPESTSRFRAGDKDEARRITGLSGDPAVLWVGHLDSNKDPLTVLQGISRAVPSLPNLELYCCFASAPLLQAVEEKIAGDSHLRERVHLLGAVPHESVELLMRAADFFVLGSHREGSGYSLIEALACGLPPLVTDIPSFRSLTNSGRVGALWAAGNAEELRERLVSVAAQPRPELRTRARAHFERELSFDAVGRKLASTYQDLLDRSGRRAEQWSAV